MKKGQVNDWIHAQPTSLFTLRFDTVLLLILVHQAVDELLAAGADPNLPLSCRVGNALCAAANIYYNPGPRLRNRIKLVHHYSMTV